MSNITKVCKNTQYLLKTWWKQTPSSVGALPPVHLIQTFPFVNTQLARFQQIPWRRERLPTPVSWPGECHELYSPWGHKESDTAEQLSLSGMKECSYCLYRSLQFDCLTPSSHTQ